MLDHNFIVSIANAVRRIIVFILFFFAGLLGCGQAATENAGGISEHGVSAVLLPQKARPGDVVELRIEMDREAWGKFEFVNIVHPKLRAIVEESIPVSLSNKRYTQRHSLYFQPVSSGVIKIGGAAVNLTTAKGSEFVKLPAMSLDVVPFVGPALSDSPVSLPPDEAAAESSSMLSVLFWGGVAFSILGVGSLIFFGMRNRRTPSLEAASSRTSTAVEKIIESLSAGVIPKDDLETLFLKPNLSISAELRSKIEQAVYSAGAEPTELSSLLRRELRS